MKLDELVKLGKVEAEFEVIKGLKIKLHTLSMEAQHRALTSVPATLNDATGQFHHLQRALLVEATELINDEKPSKEELVKFYSEIQENVFQQIASKYTDLLQQQNEVTKELEKDFK
jgi:hypothetical protein